VGILGASPQPELLAGGMAMLRWWTRISLPNRILLFIALGIVLGLVMGPATARIKFIGDIFVNLIMMMVFLLVIPALISGMAKMENPRQIGNVGLTIMIVFLATTVVAGVLALVLGHLTSPGAGLNLPLPKDFKYIKPTQTFLDVLVGIIPRNAFGALSAGNLLAVLFVVLFAGAGVISMGEKAKLLKSFFAEWTELAMKLLMWTMELAPFGAGALMAWSVGFHGPKVLGPLALFVVVVYIGEILLLVEYAFILLASGIRPFKFFRMVSEPALVSFTTCSSMATLGVNVKATEKMGVPEGVATFGITLGNVVNMDGTALYQALAVLFVSQAYNIPLDLGSQIMVVFMATVVTISLVGVPGAGTASLGLLLIAVGLPVEAIGLILAVDRICDMPRTMNNCIGDSMSVVVSAKWWKLLSPQSELLARPATQPGLASQTR
jgi:Na+/H+-dicarboxylate symporter